MSNIIIAMLRVMTVVIIAVNVRPIVRLELLLCLCVYLYLIKCSTSHGGTLREYNSKQIIYLLYALQ